MFSFFNIRSVALYEAKTLLRSWFFLIFAAMTLCFIGAMDVLFYSGALDEAPWLFRALPSFIPYLNISWLNLVQAVLAIFLATEFFKRDKKMDTTEVIYMRNMTNGDYIFGKLLGMMAVFLGLNVTLLVVAGTIHGVFSDRPFAGLAYLLYPLLISIPTLVYTFGLAFLMMILVRNQAVTFVILLGYAAGILFFVVDRYHGLYDYLSFYQPLMLSDFIGISSVTLVLLQRGFYLLLGIGLIFITILLLPRLPQSPALRKFAIGIICLIGLAASLMVYEYHHHFSRATALRKKMAELNQPLIQQPILTVQGHRLHLFHEGKSIRVHSYLCFTNKNSDSLRQALFSLNPGLQINRITRRAQAIPFVRDGHLLTFTLDPPLAHNVVDSVEMMYHGSPDEGACYTDLSEEILSQRQRFWTFTSGKKYCILQPKYVLLTPESLWYPISGLPFSAYFPASGHRDFVHYTLHVQTDPTLQAISQGACVSSGTGEFIFKSEISLSQCSLIIGQYQNRSVQVDQTTYQIWHRPGHDYFSPYFKNVQDTLAVIIRELRQDYERRLGLNYPYQRLSLIEVPVQFATHQRLHTVQQESVLPEMILIPEYGVGINGADFPERYHRLERMSKRMSQVLTPEELQIRLFRTFVEQVLFGNRADRSAGSNWTSLPSQSVVFPLFYSTGHHFFSKTMPLFNVACEAYLYYRSFEETGRQGMSRMFAGISFEETANMQLMKNSLREILAERANSPIARDVLRVKGEYLFKHLESCFPSGQFLPFMTRFIAERRFQETEAAELITALSIRQACEVAGEYADWQESKRLPAFLISDVQAYKVLDQDRTRYQVRFKVANPESAAGLISVNFRRGGPMAGGPGAGQAGGPGGMGAGGGRPFGGGDETTAPDRLYRVAGHEVKEIGVVLDDAPALLSINTLISKNLPILISYPLAEMKLRESAAPFSGEHPAALSAGSEDIIVDNEDQGFSFDRQVSGGLLKKWLMRKTVFQEQKYQAMVVWNPPQNWTPTVSSDFYGRFVHSAIYIKSGKGDKTCSWAGRIPSAGHYDIYFYVARMPRFFRDRGANRRGRELAGTFHFKVYHDDGVEELAIDVQDAEPGWNLLSTHYLSAASARVTLSDESDGRIVYADAVKWVKR